MTFLARTCILAVAVAFAAPVDAASRRFCTIGTGGVTGVYYPAGGAISKIVSRNRSEHRIRASVEVTGGSVFNINAVMAGELTLGLCQSDRQYEAYRGEGEWEEAGAQEKLRACFSLHPEIVTLVASVESGIGSIADLRGKRVNIGNPGSGHRANAEMILRAHDIDPEDDIGAEILKAPEAPRMLQDGRLDAFFYTVGHPSGAIKEATNGRREVRLVSITGVDAIVDAKPYYGTATIPAGTYEGAANGEEDVTSIGLLTTVVASTDTDEDLVYTVTKEVFTHLDDLRAMHPALSNLTAEGMLRGLSAPLHPGAKRYFEEAGLLEE